MKYKIIKKSSKTLKKIYEPENKHHFEVKYSEWYEAKRKGKIFGFWHTVGHEAYFNGELMPHSEKTVEAIEDYVRKWHEVRYSKLPIEIVKVKDIEL